MFHWFRKSSIRTLRNRYFEDDTAVVIETINGAHQTGRVKDNGGIYWSAVSYYDERIFKGQRVRFLGRQGNLKIVEPIDMPGIAKHSNHNRRNSPDDSAAVREPYSPPRRKLFR